MDSVFLIEDCDLYLSAVPYSSSSITTELINNDKRLNQGMAGEVGYLEASTIGKSKKKLFHDLDECGTIAHAAVNKWDIQLGFIFRVRRRLPRLSEARFPALLFF